MANHHELYDRLNVSIDSSPEQIRSTFHRLSRQCHPDRLGSQDLSEDERNARLQEVRKYLDNIVKSLNSVKLLHFVRRKISLQIFGTYILTQIRGVL